ncbi:hypothetical protein BIFBIF_00832 [Bifidobacterium bifidum ATCC 29521 = JCM 1255 = DSM 20456]|nr:hypothetical protein BIFBIF_00832 [Bifidobacterium bifidum ATCC 29521 = JCM 1255 = DSM 20456]
MLLDCANSFQHFAAQGLQHAKYVDFLRFKHIKQASNLTHPHGVPVAERWHDLRHAVKFFYSSR